MKVILVVPVTVNVVVVLSEKLLSLGSLSIMTRFIPSPFLIPNQRPYCPLFESNSSLIAPFTRTLTPVMMYLMWDNLVIFASIIVRILLKIITILTELRISGIRQNAIYESSFWALSKECKWYFNHSELKFQIFTLK